ncbi:hypothetical protein BPY_20950 [Bifidobacterium psychraerophilum]|uniref:DivIVA domain-containing protein n=1 Tax=Bifidobacterium psychraerophilum TaxID=218140 RepID=UPI0031153902
MLTPKDIDKTRFKERLFRRGYDRDQVEEFVDEARTTIEALISENRRLSGLLTPGKVK